MTTELPPIDATDYRTRMQGCARAFLEQHQAEHLAGDPQLFERACQHLVQALDVPLFLAPRLAQLAMSELQPYPRIWVGWDLASGPDRQHP
ncbi:hypothetical protein BVH03_25070 [Pseudomonas sp. PA15(2017)]|uniref:hypothetical protein n=1 Tax=Pseudomonas sp. PA15(2017) TaxID=1932111 RepID=UPI000959AFA0|nr:hypothetical protein [Pseudomonas sp. PA15(2017)]OLU22495.1 hypothetical protein BVH03_25070 [Pseudomonas sp. PA15(2017)]